jgi:hypothetical protein
MATRVQNKMEHKAAPSRRLFGTVGSSPASMDGDGECSKGGAFRRGSGDAWGLFRPVRNSQDARSRNCQTLGNCQTLELDDPLGAGELFPLPLVALDMGLFGPHEPLGGRLDWMLSSHTAAGKWHPAT